MARLPLFQGINIPDGLQSIALHNIQILINTLSESDLLDLLNQLLALFSVDFGYGFTIAGAPVAQNFYTSSDGTKLYIQFDKNMSDPSLSYDEFILYVNDVIIDITAAALNVDNSIIELTPETTFIFGDEITISYQKGTIVATDLSILQSFSNQAVTNNAPSLYQTWAAYPVTPVLTTSYPYQVIGRMNGGYHDRYLFCSPNPIYKGLDYGTYSQYRTSAAGGRTYLLDQATTGWTLANANAGEQNYYDDSLYECNRDIYTDATLTAVLKVKTTP